MAKIEQFSDSLKARRQEAKDLMDINKDLIIDHLKYSKDTIIERIPGFSELLNTKNYRPPLAQYRKKTVIQFLSDYMKLSGRSKPAYDALVRLIVDTTAIEAENAPQEVNTIFPEFFDATQSVGENMKRALNEMIDYYRRYADKYKKRIDCIDGYFNQNMSVNEIEQKYGVSRTTIIDNTLRKLFVEGELDEVKFQPQFFQLLTEYFVSHLYKPFTELVSTLGLQEKETSQLMYVLGYETYENKDFINQPIVIKKGDVARVKECIRGVLITLSCHFMPVDKDEAVNEVSKVIDSDKFLPDFVSFIISHHPKIYEISCGQYLMDASMVQENINRISRIIYDSKDHSAQLGDIRKQFKSLYGKSIIPMQASELKERHIYMVKEGSYMYSETPLRSISEEIDSFINEKKCFSWADLLAHLINIYGRVIIKDGASEKAQANSKCSHCKTQGVDQLVLKGYEKDYPSFDWSTGRVSDLTNRALKRMVELIDNNGGVISEKDLIDTLKKDIVAWGSRADRATMILNKFTNGKDNDPVIFLRDSNGRISIDDDVLSEIDLDYYGLGYKHNAHYTRLYALAISELQKIDNHQMLRSDFIRMVVDELNIDGITINIARKAFDYAEKLPKLLSLTGSGRATYIKLDYAQVKSDEKQEKQYRVADDTPSASNSDTPDLEVDTKKRLELSYRQKFTWDEILSDLKHDLARYNAPYFFPGITTDETLGKFKQCMSRSKSIYLNTIVPQAYYDLNNAMVERWTCFDLLSKIVLSFETLLTDIFYQNKGVESQTRGLSEIMDLAYPEYKTARRTFDKSGFNGIMNSLYNERNLFAHAKAEDIPTVYFTTQNFIKCMALYVYTVAKYYKK